MSQTKTTSSFRLSNVALLVVIGILSIGILLDGTLYNKPPAQTAIHPLGDASSIEVKDNDQSILRLQKIDNQWLQTHPVKAPAQTLRVQPLLDTNKYNQRSYALSEFSQKDAFEKKITLSINGVEYHFGAVEPVSNLRYVLSDDRVYLQPDTVLPMLSAVDTVFADLKLTDLVTQVVIGETSIDKLDAWSDLMATGIVDLENTDNTGQSLPIKLVENKTTRLLTARKTDSGLAITSDNGFTYLIPHTSAESLGLADLLSAIGQ